MRITRNHIQDTIELPLSLDKGSLIDFETTGFPWINGCEIVTLGYFSNNDIVITQRRTRTKHDYYVEISKILDSLPRPFFSYNTLFEGSVMRNLLNISVQPDLLVDIMKPWRRKAEAKGMKWPKLDELMSEPEDYFKDQKICGKDIPKMWSTYLKVGTESYLKRIMEHCLSDMLREAILLLRYHPSSAI
jgi:hypothetical protein